MEQQEMINEIIDNDGNYTQSYLSNLPYDAIENIWYEIMTGKQN